MGTALLKILWWIPDDNHAGFWWGKLKERITWETQAQMGG
jgi:hypothetical protein